MLLRERRHSPHAPGGVVVCLCFILLGVDATASAAMAQESRVIGASSIAGPHSTSLAMDCPPSAGCYIAPAPSVHSPGGEGQQPEEPDWRVHAGLALVVGEWVNTRDRPAQVPLRIAYCRWRN